MTEKERHQEFYNPDNWAPSVEFRSNDFIRVLVFTFYDLTVYHLEIFTNVYHWDKERPEYREEWNDCFYFIRKGGHLERVGTTDIWKLMKEAEKKEMAS